MAKINEFGQKVKSIDIKKVVKTLVMAFGIILIIFISFFDMKFDFENIDWERWIARTTVLVGIMIFGILMGNSTGSDIQKEKTVYDEDNKLVGGLYQLKCAEYEDIRKKIKDKEDSFSSWWLYFKERKLIEKKIDYLIDNQVDMRLAKLMVKHLDKDDFVVGKMIYDPSNEHEKIYVKELEDGKNIKFKKIKKEEADEYIKIFSFQLDTYSESYYLSLYDNGDIKTNDAELGKKLAEKIKKDRRNAMILKIVSSLVISIAWSALTVYDFLDEGGASAVKQAWINLLTRFTALITSYISGFSTSVVNVRDQARAIENKAQILSIFDSDIESKKFVPETYEESIEREYQEQLSNTPKTIKGEIVDNTKEIKTINAIEMYNSK